MDNYGTHKTKAIRDWFQALFTPTIPTLKSDRLLGWRDVREEKPAQ